MGLFSTIASSTTGEDGQTTTVSSSSAKIPTVVQLFSSNKYIHLDSTSKVNGYTAMTYQAVQVGSSAIDEQEVKNRHQNPDLGVWNCRVSKGNEPQALVDSLLAKKSTNTFCLTVNLSDEMTVEPTLTLLQSALVRHLIENPPSGDPPVTATTSLYKLQATTFGLATEDKQEEKNINESDKDVMTTVMICAVLPQQIDETNYQKKQAKALLIYHLRKFALDIDCSLVFVEEEENSPETSLPPPSNPPTPSAGAASQEQSASHASASQPSKAIVGIEQPTVNYDKVSQLWRDLALGQEVWKVSADGSNTTTTAATGGEETAGQNAEDTTEQEEPIVETPIYGPGRHQEDSIETVLLRNAHYPGHWEAQKDSVWVALPTPPETTPEATSTSTGDGGWLGQLRESIVSASDTPKKKAAEEGKEEKPPEKDAAVSDFFANLLKNP